MSEDRSAPPSAAEALYPGGPINDGPGLGRTKELIESGIAKPAASPFAEERPSPRTERGTERRGEPTPFDANRYQPPEGYQAHPELMREFAGLAREERLSHRGGERMLELFTRAQEADKQAYAQRLAAGVEELQRELHPEHLATARALINDPEMTPPEMRQWLATWGSHPAVARMLTAWAGAIRRGRY